ncbi:MAG: TIGR03013 family XrtA/PEP-CTERM system glycosyltransferase [Nitrospinota bacterium]
MYYIFNRYLSVKTIIILLSEFIFIFLIALLTIAIRFGFEKSVILSYDTHLLKTSLITGIYIITFYYFNLYSPELFRPGRQMVIKLLQASTVGSILLFSIYFIFPDLKTWRGILLLNILILPPLFLAWRILLSKWMHVKLTSRRVLIIGSGELAKKIGGEIFNNHEEYGLRLFGFIDDDPVKLGQSIVNPGVIGGYGDITRIVNTENIDSIIVALHDRRAKLPMSALLDCKLKGVGIEEGETFNERMTGKIPLDHLKPSWVVFSDGFKSLRSKKLLKRIFDISVSTVGLIFSAPIMLITAVLIKLESKGPVMYKQPRVGEHGKEFNIYKFRSMRQDAETGTGPVWAKTNDDRITRIGKTIRKLRIDELPQLINVIKGDMSFVGPRPERAYFINKLKEVIPYYEMRNVVKPGVTGWAQIKYPYGATFNDALEKLQYDIYYIKNMSPLLDIMIFFWTIKFVLTGKVAI